MKVRELKNELLKFDDNLDIDIFERTSNVFSNNPTRITLKQVENQCVIYKTCY